MQVLTLTIAAIEIYGWASRRDADASDGNLVPTAAIVDTAFNGDGYDATAVRQELEALVTDDTHAHAAAVREYAIGLTKHDISDYAFQLRLAALTASTPEPDRIGHRSTVVAAARAAGLLYHQHIPYLPVPPPQHEPRTEPEHHETGRRAAVARRPTPSGLRRRAGIRQHRDRRGGQPCLSLRRGVRTRMGRQSRRQSATPRWRGRRDGLRSTPGTPECCPRCYRRACADGLTW